MKRFIIGFIIGIGLMYWYLHNGTAFEDGTIQWFQHSASGYRGDAHQNAAHQLLGESEHNH